MLEYSPHELKTIAEHYAKLCAALEEFHELIDFPREATPHAAISLARREIVALQDEVERLHGIAEYAIQRLLDAAAELTVCGSPKSDTFENWADVARVRLVGK
jgi:hypothetical protein